MTASQPRLAPGECRPMTTNALGCRCARCDHYWIVTTREVGAHPVRPRQCPACDSRTWDQAVPRKVGRPRKIPA